MRPFRRDDFPEARKGRHRRVLTAGVASASVLGGSIFGALCFPMSAQAQFYGGGWGGYGYAYGPYRGAPYGGPDPYYGPDDEGYDDERGSELGPGLGPRPRKPASAAAKPAIISLETIKRRIDAAGFHLIATPRQKGDIYLAEVEDAKSIRHRLVYDAHDGHLIENTLLGPIKKKLPSANES